MRDPLAFSTDFVRDPLAVSTEFVRNECRTPPLHPTHGKHAGLVRSSPDGREHSREYAVGPVLTVAQILTTPDNTSHITNIILTAGGSQNNYQTAVQSAWVLIRRVITGRTPDLDGSSLHPELDRRASPIKL